MILFIQKHGDFSICLSELFSFAYLPPYPPSVLSDTYPIPPQRAENLRVYLDEYLSNMQDFPKGCSNHHIY